jgi:16S rRNA (cytosine1402-N4)-methyltransferase
VLSVPSTPTGSADSPADDDAIHRPVLLEEILAFFSPAPGQWILDGTLGFAGHTERFLQAGAEVIGVDQDPQALEHARARLRGTSHFHPLRGNAADLPRLLSSDPALPSQVDAILFDLGTSSWQLDQAERGFSFRADGPLDMRMDPERDVSAADLVNTLGETELAELLWTYGEERASRRIARVLCQRRADRPFERTLDLAETIARLVKRPGKIHPATRTFQALRIAVNRELDVLPQMLTHATTLLKPGGKLAVISFHSLEDRIVKRFLRKHSTATLDDPTWPAPRPNPGHHFDLHGKLIQPGSDECQQNPRSRSAKLRCALRRPHSL